MFEDASVEANLKVKIPQFSKPDELVWIKEAKSNFTVKSAYKISQEYKLSLNQDHLEKALGVKNSWKNNNVSL